MISTQLDLKPMRDSIGRLKLLVVLLMIALGILLQTQKPAAASQAQAQRLFEIIGMNVPFEERVGADDGVAFAVHFGGDTHGNLDACG